MVKSIANLIVCIFLLGATSTVLKAQSDRIDESDVPLKVQAKFYGKYKDAADVSWKQNNDGRLEALFFTKNRKVSVLYEKSGKIVQVENISRKAVLSEEVSNHIETRFPDAKLIELKKVTKFYLEGTSGPQHYYELLLKEGKTKTSVFFDGEMNLMKADNIFNLAVN